MVSRRPGTRSWNCPSRTIFMSPAILSGRVILTVHGTPIPGWARRAASLECCGVVVHPTDFVPDDPYQILALNDQENPC